MATSNATVANATYLANKTGLNPAVALAWLLNEGQSVANPTNPLNIEAGGTSGQTGTQGGFGVYASTQAGLDAAASLINSAPQYAGIRAAIKGGNSQSEAQAIQNSPWAKGHYSFSGITNSLTSAVAVIAGQARGGGPPPLTSATGGPGSSIGAISGAANPPAPNSTQSTGPSLDPLAGIPQAIVAAASYIGALALIVVGIWLYSKGSPQKVEYVGAPMVAQ